jgi:hypothetical protein
MLQIHDGDGKRTDPLTDVPWIWGIEEFPGLNTIVWACVTAFQEARNNAYRRAFPKKK